jgi:hypothetical protein
LHQQLLEKSAETIQNRVRGHRARLLYERKKATVVVQAYFRRWGAIKNVARLRSRCNNAAIYIQKYSRQWYARKMLYEMVEEHRLTILVIMKDHQFRTCATVVQRQWRRFVERRKCYRFRVVANAVVLKMKLNKSPGRIVDLSAWTVEEELDRILLEYRKWNPKKYYRTSIHRRKLPQYIMNIQNNRQSIKKYHLELLFASALHVPHAVRFKLGTHMSSRVTKKIKGHQHDVVRDYAQQEDHHKSVHNTTYQMLHPTATATHAIIGTTNPTKTENSTATTTTTTTTTNHPHPRRHHSRPHHHEHRAPAFTTILDERKFHTFACGTITQYKVRWRGADCKESWMARKILMDPTIFSKHCIGIVEFHEKKMVAHALHQSNQNMEQSAMFIQKTIFRGCLARLHLWQAQRAALTIQTYYRASHGKLEQRRNKLLKARWNALMMKERNDIEINESRKQTFAVPHAGAGEIKFNDLVHPTSHPIAGEISSIVSQLQTDLKQEVSRVVNGKTYVVTMTHSWICLACEFENEFERSKCELCYKNRPPKDWNDFKI